MVLPGLQLLSSLFPKQPSKLILCAKKVAIANIRTVLKSSFSFNPDFTNTVFIFLGYGGWEQIPLPSYSTPEKTCNLFTLVGGLNRPHRGDIGSHNNGCSYLDLLRRLQEKTFQEKLFTATWPRLILLLVS